MCNSGVVGVVQAAKLNNTEEGIVILHNDPHYYSNLARSEFCLAPSGDGWVHFSSSASLFGPSERAHSRT
eukprot:9252552-Pyramimonas_sp.AAC.1